jgi:hypothetical protein
MFLRWGIKHHNTFFTDQKTCMKYTFAFTMFFLSISVAFSQYNGITFGFPGNKAASLQANNIQKEYVFIYNYNRKGIKDSFLIKVNHFNQWGDLVETQEPAEKNTLAGTEKNQYVYNNNNDIIKKSRTGKWSSQADITEYEYDSLGNITGIYNYPADTTRLSIENRVYDLNDNIVSVTSTFNLEPPFISKKYSYYKDSTITVVQSFNSKGELQYTDIYETDSSTNSKSIYLENLRGRELKNVLVYDSQKRVIKELSDFQDMPTFFKIAGIISGNSAKRVSEHIYNTDGLLLETNIFLNSKIVQSFRHFYERR